MRKKKWVQSLAAAVLLTGVAASGVPASQADTSQGSQTTTSAVDSTRRPVYRWQYLVTKPISTPAGAWAMPVTISINGRTYIKSMTGQGYEPFPSVVNFILARKCKELRAVVGMTDDSPPEAVYSLQITKLPSQRMVYNGTVRFGRAVPIRLNMRGALQVRFESQDVSGDPSGWGRVGVGSPRVLCRIR